MAKAQGKLTPAISDAAVMHASMKSIRDYLVSVGLAQLAVSGGYDVSGSSSQVPTASGGVSAWMAFAFTDADQAAFPIVIVIRIGRWTLNGYSVYGYQYGVADGIQDGTTLIGRSSLSSTPASGGTAYHQWYINVAGNLGDFVRYSGDTLTLLVCHKYRNVSGPLFHSGIVMHVERMRRKDGSVESGWACILDRDNYSANSGTTNLTVEFTEGTGVYTDAALSNRIAGPRSAYDGGVPVVAPICYVSELDQAAVPFRKAFSIAAAVVTNGGFIRLDFSGEEKPYLAFAGMKQHIAGSPTYGVIFEWE
ncbi:hypothetical protein E5198_00915 [Pseudomonas sp. A-1]|uniref:hypothetical protein n=1 Tax=Pseudomonas sp. A-1 TaxID=1821274 RepID=UPI0010A5EEFC|nr:hypothetical protein [Pseudomonas sp. A-1]THG87106.1 hypothetical protein E5198_00915 [Pseudomonas sp. A-1]